MIRFFRELATIIFFLLAGGCSLYLLMIALGARP